jgi:hypothetical protein
MDGWYEWNSCTDHPLYQGPNCSLYNAANCTEQTTSTGINVHGTRVVDLPVTCPRDTNGDGVPDAGGCKDIAQYASGTNFMSLYELDPVCCDQLVQTVYYSPVTLPLSCDSLGCAPIGSGWMDPVFWDSPSTPAKSYRYLYLTLLGQAGSVDQKSAAGVSMEDNATFRAKSPPTAVSWGNDYAENCLFGVVATTLD